MSTMGSTVPDDSSELLSDVVQAYFFRAMRGGYASGMEPAKDVPFPHWKTLTHEEGDLRLVDMWHTTPNSPFSSGVTTIYHRMVPAWVMHYGGWYNDWVIPVLRAALKSTYEQGLFVGCRGPVLFQVDDWMYTNDLARNSDFVSFFGEETIRDSKTGLVHGTHWYNGHWLFEGETTYV